MAITPIQWLLIFIAALGAISGGSAQMTDLFGSAVAKDVASAASFLSSIISAIMLPLTGQNAQVRAIPSIAQTPAGQEAVMTAVENMPGVDGVNVNRKANQIVAAMAVDPAHDKVSALPGDQTAVAAIAKGV